MSYVTCFGGRKEGRVLIKSLNEEVAKFKDVLVLFRYEKPLKIKWTLGEIWSCPARQVADMGGM